MSGGRSGFAWLRVVGGVVTAGAPALPADRIVRQFIPPGYAMYAESYADGLAIFQWLLLGGGILLLLWPKAVGGWLFSSHAEMQGGGAPAPFSRRAVLWMGGLAALALALRLPGLGRSFTFDEAFLVKSLITQNPIRIFVHPSGSAHVLHTLPAHFAVRLLGLSEWSARLPALIAGVLAPPVLYWALRRAAMPSRAWMAGLLSAISPFHIWYSQEAKGNAPLVLCVVWSWLLYEQLRYRWTPTRAIVYVLILVAAGLSHLSGALFILGQGVALVATAPAGRGRRWRWVGVHGTALYLTALAQAVIVPFLLREGQAVTKQEGAATLRPLLWSVLERFTFPDAPPFFAAVFVVLALCGAWRLGRERKDWLALTVGPFAVGALLTVFGGLFSHARYHMAFLPGLIVLGAAGLRGLWGIANVKNRWLVLGMRAGAVAVALLIGAGWVRSTTLYYRFPKSNFKAVAAFLTQESRGRDVYVAGSQPGGYPALGLAVYGVAFDTDQTLPALVARGTPADEVLVVALDLMHFATAYPALATWLREQGQLLRRFECLGEMDQFRVRESKVFVVKREALAEAVESRGKTGERSITEGRGS